MIYASLIAFVSIMLNCILIKSIITKDKEYKAIKSSYDKLKKYQEETDEKINALHTGNTVDNALDILSKH